MLEAQRAAFFADLPVPLSMRRNRLNRLASLIAQNADALCAALVADGVARDADSAKSAEVEPALATLRATMDGLDHWMRPQRRHGLRALLREGSDYVEYQPIGVIGIAAPASLLQTITLLANALAAGNRLVVALNDTISPRLAQVIGQLAPSHFDPLELTIVSSKAIDDMTFDFRVTSDCPEGETLAYSDTSPAILGRSADFAAASTNLIAHKRSNAGRTPLGPDYLLVPEDQEEAIAGWLWRAAMQPTTDRSTLTDGQQAELTRLLEDARARGGDVMLAESPGAATPLHIVRHATDDMLVMQQNFRGPILPLRNYARIEDAIATIQRHTPPRALYYFGRDAAERDHVLNHTLSSAISIDGRSVSMVNSHMVSAPETEGDETDFRRFSRARRVCLPSTFDFLRWPSRERGDELGGAAFAPN